MGFIYCLFSLRYFYFKIGLSGTPKSRRKTITKSIKEELNKNPWIIPVFGVWVWDMEESEKKIHRVLKPWNFTWVGSGASEWHKKKLSILDLIFALLVALFLMGLMWIESGLKLIIGLTVFVTLFFVVIKMING